MKRRKAAKEAKKVSAQEGVVSGSAVQDAHQGPKCGGQETATKRAGVSMSADTKLGPGDKDKSTPDASVQASVGGAGVVESSPPEQEVEASDDEDAEYVETKKVPFGPADDLEVLEVDSDSDN
ncbi:unnamed protein product [Phytophthora fragariaefolia]|uniref:Unnamed protein product n=1 Tax=Phytophthora fragariaefolia TaxID=1490495 RepID=A0A9W6XMM0_9STRA|nr:unnamed protein product [Phytophthora fragariaefolia]